MQKTNSADLYYHNTVNFNRLQIGKEEIDNS